MDAHSKQSSLMIPQQTDFERASTTEKLALAYVREVIPEKAQLCYLAIPWSSVLDNNKVDKNAFQLSAAELQVLQQCEQVFTVCDSPHLKSRLNWLREIGVTDVYWPYKNVEVDDEESGIRVHAFPVHAELTTP